MAESLHQRVDRGAGDDRNDHLCGKQPPGELAHDALQHLRLDGEHDEISAVRRIGVALRRFDTEPLCELLAAIFPGVTGDDVRGRDEGLLEQPGDHRLGHDSGADKGDPGVGQRIAGLHDLFSRRCGGIGHVRPPASDLCHHCSGAQGSLLTRETIVATDWKASTRGQPAGE